MAAAVVMIDAANALLLRCSLPESSSSSSSPYCLFYSIQFIYMTSKHIWDFFWPNNSLSIVNSGYFRNVRPNVS